MSKTGHRIDEEESLAGVAARQWMGTLYIPVDAVDHVVEETRKVALDKVAEDLANVDLRWVCAICCRRCRHGAYDGESYKQV